MERSDKVTVGAMKQNGFRLFSDLASFTREVEAVSGSTWDFTSVVKVGTDFLQTTDKAFIMNVKGVETEAPDNLLFLTENDALLYSKMLPGADATTPFREVMGKPFGRSTVLAFLTLSGVLNGYKPQLERLSADTKGLETNFDPARYRELSLQFERLEDRLEEFNELLIRLQESCYQQVETRYIGFDWSVLISESASLDGRCRRRFTLLREVRQDHEAKITNDLNIKIANLNDVVRRLTAITVILMLPTLIASHFGMNFEFMPELRIWWAYWVVIGFQLFLVGIGVWLFRKIGWL